ncbi:MAG: hypothetical protein ACTSRP_18385 [Candidatus Helarchaeota archaeon]
MQNTRDILNTFLNLIKDEIDSENLSLLVSIESLLKRADFRKKYYRLKLWKALTELGNANPSIKESIENLLTDLADRWEKTLTKALDNGLLNS